jgi:hypothetical protein
VQDIDQPVVVDLFARQHDPFVEPNEVRRGVDVDLGAAGLQHGAQEGDR